MIRAAASIGEVYVIHACLAQTDQKRDGRGDSERETWAPVGGVAKVGMCPLGEFPLPLGRIRIVDVMCNKVYNQV